LLQLLLENGTGLPLAVVLTLLSLGAASIHLYARPHILGWLLSLLWFAALDRWESAAGGQGRVPRWLPWSFPISMLLWVNVHGSWIFGMTILAAFSFAAWIERLRTREPLGAIAASQRARAMCQVLGLSALATFVNPYGWRLHEHIYGYLGNPYLMRRIDEFRSPDFHGWAQRCFGILVLLLLSGFAVHRGKVRLSHLLVALLAVCAGFYSSRNLPVSSMLLALISGPILWKVFSSLADRTGAWNCIRKSSSRVTSFADRMAIQEWRLGGHLWPVVAVVAAAGICLHGGWLGTHHLLASHFDEQKVPAAAVEYLDQHGDTGPVFSTDAWGGYLIYHWYPTRRVVIDDRHDFYGSDRIRDYLVMMQGEIGWKSALEKWHVRTALLPAGAPLANLLGELPQEWHLEYADKVAVVLERNPETKTASLQF
jgi:hypothetical protein